MKFQKLNLGSGAFKLPGFVNVDINSKAKPDVIHDLNRFPYPFKANQFTEVRANHVLEHLQDPFQVMHEIHRITAHNARVIIRVPHFSRGFTHADHKRGFDVTFPYYFNPNFIPGYQGSSFKLQKIRLRWFAQAYMKKDYMSGSTFFAGLTLGVILNFLANLSPFICSRIWCFWVGGFEEITFEFRTNKLKRTAYR